MATRSSALTSLVVLIAATAGPVLAEPTIITIEQINTVVFPADGATAAEAICAGLASGLLTRDQVGSDLARLQKALSEVNESGSVNRYIKSFNSASAGINGCNVQVTGPAEDNRWNY
ncbi:putative conserved secreted protein [Synechococcus sp. BIOS-U3-1]|uniref:DNA ligase n=1 Tax=Synechococcus sp. BIOS-U3-1 TaxID=1400865 RepID=UPI0018628420|nr:DNA ligase [Synechococcus sp. BIOS-U3-1]QNI58390.1 putative conserved secreted protein [Synechococcus sp. BIOS-U3-1]|tara:strand:- start:1033 stop:1383 length:351 start_codon:yes stop_codon:yes gene_type:complete